MLLAVVVAALLATYQPYVGQWACTKPTMGQAWWASLNVTATSDNKMRFEFSSTTPNGPPGGLFYVYQHPTTGVWALSTPNYPWVLHGPLENGVIKFAAPKPQELQVRLGMSADGKTMTFLTYNERNVPLNLANYIVSCTHGSPPAH